MTTPASLDESFSTQLAACKPKLKALVSRWVADCEVDDLLSEALERAWRAYPDFRGESSFYTWAYQVTRSEIIDQLRASKAPAKAFEFSMVPLLQSEDGTTQDSPSPAPSVEARAISKQIVTHLQAALSELPERDAKMFHLTTVEGHSQAEVARLTGVSESTVQARVAQIRRRLRERLAAFA